MPKFEKKKRGFSGGGSMAKTNKNNMLKIGVTILLLEKPNVKRTSNCAPEYIELLPNKKKVN